MNRRVMVALLTFSAAFVAASSAFAASLPATDDALAYQFIPTTPWGGVPPFSSYLPAGLTTTGHDIKSALKFDVASLGITSAQVGSATIDLFVVPTEDSGFGVSPTPSAPVTVNLSALSAGAWNQNTVTWANMPAAGAQYASQVVSGTNILVSFDVTQLVKDWLDNTIANNGVVLQGNAPVGASPNWAFAVFNSTNAGGTVPALTVNVVPEPGSIALAIGAVPALLWLGRRRLRGRRA
jgi:uncharacterized protein (TIGR03382 family)